MALTRKFLKGLGIEDDKIDTIIEAHTETVDALKTERDGYKTDAEEYAKIKPDYDKLVAGDYEKKFNDLTTEYNNYKSTTAEKETTAKKQSAYKELLKKAGVSEKRLDTILKVTDIKGLELNPDGTLKDSDTLAESIKSEWSDFVVKTEQKGANTETPPSSNGGAGDEPSRAAKVAKRYYENLYGGVKE